MSKRSRSKPGVVGPSDVESFASLVSKPTAGEEDGDESFASLVKKPRARTKEGKAKKKKRPRTSAGATSRKRASTKDKGSTSKPKRPPVAPPERYTTRVAVFENGASNQKRAVDVSTALGYTAEDTRRDNGKLRALLEAEDKPQLLLLGMPGCEEIIATARELSPQTLVIASMPGPAESARKRAEELYADLFVVRPHTKDSLAVVLLAAEKLARTTPEIARLRATEVQLRERLQGLGAPDNETGFQHFDFFERVLIMEIKRAKRFGYSLATALVSFDEAVDGHMSADARSALRERVAKAIRANIRDIDLPVDYADGRILLFLPYTDLEGATEVGRRVAAAVRQFGNLEIHGKRVSCSVSIGISAVRPGNAISFARLMKDAQQALRAAQLKGGDRVVVRK